MAKINFGDTSKKNNGSTQNISEQIVEDASVTKDGQTGSSDTVANQPPQTINANTSSGGIQNQYNDPNKINVTIANKDVPLVILFGPAACGKTMTLVRLNRYLRNKSFKISPVRSFRPADDQNYRDLCDNFDSMINQSDASKSTALIEFMLVEVLNNGKSLCQILEAPGEYYFDPINPHNPFPNYVNTVINSTNRKIWCVFVEPDWENDPDRRNYASRIHQLKKRMRPKDKTIFVFNKIDKTDYVIAPGRVNVSQARKNVSDLYPDIFVPFRNMNPITRFFSEWRCDFVPFQTGDFTQSATDLTYQQGPEEYPAILWNTICKHIRGKQWT